MEVRLWRGGRTLALRRGSASSISTSTLTLAVAAEATLTEDGRRVLKMRARRRVPARVRVSAIPGNGRTAVRRLLAASSCSTHLYGLLDSGVLLWVGVDAVLKSCVLVEEMVSVGLDRRGCGFGFFEDAGLIQNAMGASSGGSCGYANKKETPRRPYL
jgi:hypothetical protein